VVVISILTLSLQLALVEFFIGARGITQGSSGFRWTGFDLDLVGSFLPLSDRLILYYLMAAALLGAFLFYDWLIRSRYGLAFEAIRQDVHAANATGVDPVHYQSVAGFTGAFLIGIAGSLYAQLTGFVLPSMFTFLAVDAQILIILILGGRRTLFGPLVGSVLLIAITELLRGTSELRAPILGLLLVVLFVYFPQGIVPWVERRVGALPERLGFG
jgi:branched-chain amino acid transport system permease protein